MAVQQVEAELDERFSQPGATPTSWAEVEEVLAGAELWWISSVRPDGRPHVTPLTAVWHDGALHVCTGVTEQKAVNLSANPACVLTTGEPRWREGLDVVVEGTAHRVTDSGRLQELADEWARAYEGFWRFTVADGMFQGEGGPALVYEVRPGRILAFRRGAYAQTRFRF